MRAADARILPVLVYGHRFEEDPQMAAVSSLLDLRRVYAALSRST